MTQTGLKKMKEYATDVFRVGSPGYNRAMFRYHEEAVNYWDDGYTDNLQISDEKALKNYERHCKQRDKYFNLITKGGKQ